MSSSVLYNNVFQAKINNVQNQADTSAVYSAGVWSFKNSTALTSVTIDNSGNVGVGATITSAKLTIKNPSATGEQQIINIQSAASTDAIAKVTFNQTTDVLNIANFTNTGALVFGTGGSGTERMRIDASGNLLASGKTSTNFLNTGAQINANGSIWSTVSANADGISSYGVTTSTNRVLIAGYSDVGGITSSKFAAFSDGNVRISAGATYGNFSDIKFKENIVDATPKLEDVLKLQVRNFTIKNEGLKAIGFIAQEFEQVFPALVVTSPDKDMEGNELGTESKAIKESALIPILVKAIQEQQAQIEEMKARLAALEAK